MTTVPASVKANSRNNVPVRPERKPRTPDPECPYGYLDKMLQHHPHLDEAKIAVAWMLDVKANVDGGGSTGQAGALRLAVARALVQVDEAHRRKLRDLGLLTRDARAVERKKPGRPKARKRFQFSKR